MRPNSRWTSTAGLIVGLAFVASACSSAAATTAPTTAPTVAGPAGAGAANLTLASTNDPTLGAYLTGLNGMTLYILTKDTADTSSCTGTCATNWPPLTRATGVTVVGPSTAMSPWGTTSRADGSMQVTYNHCPLYYYSGDSAAGDTKGQGKNGTWFVAPLSGSLASAAPAATPVAVPTLTGGY